MKGELAHLLSINAIELVPISQERTGFYSMVFLVAKSSGGGGVQGKLESQISEPVYPHRFKMQSLRSLLACVRQGDLLQSVDLKEAYSSGPSQVPSLRIQRPAFSVLLNAIQALLSPKDIYQVGGGGSCFFFFFF